MTTNTDAALLTDEQIDKAIDAWFESPAFEHDFRRRMRNAIGKVFDAATTPAVQADGAATCSAFDIALDALANYQANWDTGLVQPYAESERIAMECAVEAVREAMNEARDAAGASGLAQKTIYQVWVEETSSYADVTAEYYAERLPSNRRKVYAAPLPREAATVALTDQQREAIMEQAQVFASAWSLVGGLFDYGDALETAEQEKENLRALLAASNGEQETSNADQG